MNPKPEILQLGSWIIGIAQAKVDFARKLLNSSKIVKRQKIVFYVINTKSVKKRLMKRISKIFILSPFSNVKRHVEMNFVQNNPKNHRVMRKYQKLQLLPKFQVFQLSRKNIIVTKIHSVHLYKPWMDLYNGAYLILGNSNVFVQHDSRWP